MKSREDLLLFARNKRNFFYRTTAMYAITLALAVVLFALFNDNVTLVFVMAAIVIIQTLIYFTVILPKHKMPPKIKATEGEIVKLHREKFEVNVMKTHSYSTVRKPYSKYWRDSYTLTVFVKDSGGNIVSHSASGVSSAVCDFFSVGDKVLLVTGVLLPLPLDTADSRTICPICGELGPTRSVAPNEVEGPCSSWACSCIRRARK